MLKNSFQPVHDVLLYRAENGKKGLVVDLVYKFARTMNDHISKNSLTAVTKKMTTAISKLQKKIKERAAFQDQTVERLMKLQAFHQ